MQNRFDDIRNWAEARNLITGSTPEKQFIKLMEEAGELAAAMARYKEREILDSIGDMVVVLTILAKQYGYVIEHCIDHSWDEIKDRKGQMRNGVFVKEADLPCGSDAEGRN